MTDRVSALIVVLEDDIRIDNPAIPDAIRQIRGVVSVEPHVAGISEHIAKERCKSELTVKILKAIRDD